MEGHAVISHDVLASYAADAALEVDGVALVDAPRCQRGVRVRGDDDAIALEVHLAVEWGADASAVGAAVQTRVSEYVSRTAKLDSLTVDVVVEGIGEPSNR